MGGANIQSDLVVDGSVVSGTLTADGLRVGGDVFLRNGSHFADISLLGADIGGGLAVDGGSVVSGTLTAERLRVGGVFLRDGSQFTDISLLDADIGSTLEVNNGSVVSGTLDGGRARVGGDVFLSDGSQFTDVRLIDADIGGLIYVHGAKWESHGSFDLSQAHAGGVYTDERADSWPPTLWLNGFTFEQWANPDPRMLGSEWFTGMWLARLGTFSPGPYNQLAAVMDAAGHPTIAADIRYHRSHAERLEVPWSRPERWGRALYWLVLGYGLRPWRALEWFVAVWLIGFLAFRLRLQPAPAHTSDAIGDVADKPQLGRLHQWWGRVTRIARVRLVKAEQWSAGQAALYSLDRLVPAVRLINPDEVPKRTRAQQAWSIIQQFLGWLLTLFIVGWLGSLLIQSSPLLPS